ncbi:MAG: hypothetical protein KatS3mg090_0720 [Patescibacteria group bacterium]|nr:MAG: hypothetical protein KatS3mg090_0720 [Patescibacteria group bacterium]
MSKTDFNPEELEKIKQRLIKEEKKILDDIKDLQKADPFADPERLLDNEDDEDAREEVEHENIESQIKYLKSTLRDIRTALDLIEKGQYGICQMCGKAIEKQRLKLIPYARLCVSCMNKLEQ